MDMIERESLVSVEKVKPTIVTFPFLASYNQDHREVAVATHTALRPASPDGKHFVPTVLSYEEPADIWTLEKRGEPNFFVSLTKGGIDVKLAALKLYKSQLRPAPNLRSLQTTKTLAILRGSQSGNDFAEGFIAYRTIL
jgi:LmbE family N-acetylglucosaminyl deacetylase